MSMKFFMVLSVCSFMLFITACEQKNIPDSAAADPEFRVSSTIKSLLRAPQLNEDGAGKFVNGDKNTIFIKNKNGDQTSTFEYTYGTTYHWSDIRLAQEVKQCQVSACYPPVKTSDFKHFNWSINEHNDVDLLLASPAVASPSSSSPISLSFTHALHKLSVTLIPQGDNVSELLKQAVITCKNVKSVAVIDLLSGKAVEANGSIIQLTKNGEKVDFLIPAQEVGNMEISIKLGNRSVSYILSSLRIQERPLTNLESGKSFSLQVKVSNESFTIVGQHISGWEKQGEVEGTITL